MYLKVVFALLFFVPLTLTDGKELRKCEKGEYYSNCGSCDGSCENRNPICTLQCRVGCFCAEGLVRNAAGKCIPPEECCKSG